jgi:predicted glycoside hydrolase/deacetylase ChbG (UPF0249 family)
MKRLLVVADDFGYCECRSQGIAECCSVVGAVSVLVTHPPSAVALPPHVAVGLHLNLTEGAPLSHNVPSLVDAATGQMRGKIGFRGAPVPSEEDVRREVTAQLRLFEERYGAPPAHVDGHQHAHLLPVVAHVLAPLLLGRIRTRIPRQVVSAEEHPWVPAPLLQFFELVNREADAALPIYQRHKVPVCNVFMGLSTQGGMATRERVLSELRKVKDGESVEWMVHPGTACRMREEHKGDDFNSHPDRELEKELLLSLRDEILALGFELG